MTEHYHMVGINGIGLSGVARILLEMGYKVTGSDPKSSVLTDKLRQMGAKIYNQHCAENIKGADYLVVSSAIPLDNPEIIAARKQEIPILHRAQMLGYIMKERTGIAVTGTHGKTTTTSMMANLLEFSGLDPTVVVGGQLNHTNSNARLGKSEYMVVEADESDASFLFFDPRWIVITSVDVDVNLNVAPYSHLNFDYRKTLERVRNAFLKFVDKIPADGKAFLCVDDDNVRRMLPEIKNNYTTYGLSPEAEIRAEDVRLKNFNSTFKVFQGDNLLGEVALNVPGKHNVQNALAVIAQGLELGINFEKIARSMLNFPGVKRRFEKIAEVNDVLIVDDYAHNPCKIRALLQGARTGKRRRVITVFQPHRYTRTKFLFNEFTESFSDTDVLILTDIYNAGECPIIGVRGENLADAIGKSSCPPGQIHYIPQSQEIINFLEMFVRPGDIVITCGAGDVFRIAEKLADNLYQKQAGSLAAG